MEEPVKEQSTVSGNGGAAKSTLLRYSLRSASKSTQQKPGSPNSSAYRRTKASSIVSKSVGVLDISGKDKSAKPPRRLSVPAKSSMNPNPKAVGNITPIAETRPRRSAMTHPKSDTPLSDVSRSSTRKKFSALSSASYWLQQIKLSESAAKHSISLGFFKLAKEAGCEPLQKMRDELKSYAGRHNHNLIELGESVKELFECYNIVEHPEQQLQVSESFSQVAEEGSRSSDEEVRSSSSSMGKMKPKSLNTDAALAPKLTEQAKETLRRNRSIKSREPVNTNAPTSKSVPTRKVQKKPPQKGVKEEARMEKEKEKVKRQGKKPAPEGVTGADVNSQTEDIIENKENMDTPHQPEEVSAEVV